MNEIMDKVPQWLEIAAMVVTLAATIAAVTPSPKDDGIVKSIRSVIDILALNFGHAKNASVMENAKRL